jgi:hypothetical protein
VGSSCPSSENARHQPHGKRPWKKMPTHHHIWPQKEPSPSTDSCSCRGDAGPTVVGGVQLQMHHGLAWPISKHRGPSLLLICRNNGAMTSDYFLQSWQSCHSRDWPNLPNIEASVLHPWMALQGTGDQITQQAGISCRLTSVFRTSDLAVNVLFA